MVLHVHMYMYMGICMCKLRIMDKSAIIDMQVCNYVPFTIIVGSELFVISQSIVLILNGT